MTADDYRRLALGFEGVVEGTHMRHPDFRVNGRIFATLHADERTGAVNLTPDEQRAMRRDGVEVFAPAAGAWGRQGWTTVRLDVADEPTVRSALLMAWQRVAALPPGRSRPKSPARRVP